MNGGLPGFHNAPASKAVVVAAGLFSVAFGFRGHSLNLGLAYQSVYEKLSVWRLITSLFAFSSTPELIFGAALLYYFRVFERQIGSNKYAVFIIFSTMVSVLLQILSLGYMKDPSLNPLTSGPYGLIFASYVPFFFDIPISMKFRIFGLSFSDKSFVYLAGLQLLFSSGRRSIVPGLSGILAGLLYRLNTFGVRRLKFPELATSLFSQLSLPFSSNPYQGLPITENDGSIPSHQAHQIEDARAATQDPTESSIAALVTMGFDRSAAIQALALTNYDVNLASNILLEAQALQQ
ncbi:UBA/TS-N domain-containing protein [Zea mays]|uniref:Rhomboid-like protein 20 n=1 Tax=Zea mays TaxID=4577 RepID=B4F7X8_MAIZE|nr:UBA/TS-N domain-containing protein [Zea mays]ACF78221.1 unknown [Zea mays]ACG31674.1 UBA/TS-N domain [Zea mays]ONM37139.1 Rhomboid-like protein 20 [Zea mays]|eukprot:NP_001130094.1 UBA/TS-N domain-containing protein [Zea mays]